MTSFPFTIDTIPFYASTELEWRPYGAQDAYSILGRPLPSGQGSFSVVLNAVPYAASSLTGTGDPLQSSGTFAQLFALAQTAKNTNGGRSTFTVFDPTTNAYVTIKGIIDFPSLIAQMQPGMANTDVTIKVLSAFISDGDWATYTGGDTVPTTVPPYIPGDPLPAPDPGKTYGWNVGRWNYGYWGRGEGV